MRHSGLIRVCAGVTMAGLFGAIMVVDTLHRKEDTPEVQEATKERVQKNVALYAQCEFVEISATRYFCDRLMKRVNELLPDKLSEPRMKALVSFLGDILVARSEGNWDKYCTPWATA